MEKDSKDSSEKSYENNKDFKQAYKFYEEAMKLNYISADVNLVCLQLNGFGCPKNPNAFEDMMFISQPEQEEKKNIVRRFSTRICKSSLSNIDFSNIKKELTKQVNRLFPEEEANPLQEEFAKMTFI